MLDQRDSKDIYNIQINAVPLYFLYSEESWKMYHDFHKNIKQQKLFSTLIIICTIFNKWPPIKTEQQISILKWFLKDHVTLKTGVMMLKIQFKIYHILKHIQIQNSSFKLQ